FAIEKIFLRTEMILCRAKKVFCKTKKIVFVRGPIFSGSRKGLPGTKSLFFLIEAILSVAEKVISALTTHFCGMEKIFFVPDTSFFAAEMMFAAAGKTAGAVTAGLFLNHQPINIRLTLAFWRGQANQFANASARSSRDIFQLPSARALMVWRRGRGLGPSAQISSPSGIAVVS